MRWQNYMDFVYAILWNSRELARRQAVSITLPFDFNPKTGFETGKMA